jgi:hypothetical protein
VLGIWLLRPRTLVIAAATSALSFLVYSTGYLHLEGKWWLPVPKYIEHVLFALFWTGAIAGYWGAVKALAARAGERMHDADRAGPWVSRWQVRRRAAAATAMSAVLGASVVPAVFIAKSLGYPKEMAQYWYEAWPNEPELRQL